jgi:hypothetical protein
MKKVFCLLMALLIVAMTACRKEEPEPPVTQQTVFVYMPWSSDLLSYFHQNLDDMRHAIQSIDMRTTRVIVFLATSSKEATLFELTPDRAYDEAHPLKQYTHPAVTTEAGLTTVLKDMKDAAPAARQYSMIIGSHGMGWIEVADATRTRQADLHFHWEMPADMPSLTRFFGGYQASNQTDISTLSAAIRNIGVTMEYILFDDCYMSTVEVAYELKEVTRHLIGCPTEVMVIGYPYQLLGQYLIGSGINYEKLCQAFLSFYETYKTPCGTIGVTVCGELDELARLMREINSRYRFDTDRLSEVQIMDGYVPSIFFDMGDYVARLCDDPELLAQFNAQMERAVPARFRAHTRNYFTGLLYNETGGKGREMPIRAFSGITISDPATHPWCGGKSKTRWYQATHNE